MKLLERLTEWRGEGEVTHLPSVWLEEPEDMGPEVVMLRSLLRCHCGFAAPAAITTIFKLVGYRLLLQMMQLLLREPGPGARAARTGGAPLVPVRRNHPAASLHLSSPSRWCFHAPPEKTKAEKKPHRFLLPFCLSISQQCLPLAEPH